MTRRLLTGATVWAGASCAPQPAWLLIEDDHVAALGQPAQPPPAADQVLDLAGCHVLPGLVDVHLHLSQAAWFPPGEDGWGWGSLAEALHAVRTAAAAGVRPWAATSPVTGGGGRPGSCGRQPTRSPCSAPSPTPSPTLARRAPTQRWRPRRPAVLPPASPTPMTPTWHPTGTRGWSPCAPPPRCGCRGAPVPLLGCTPGHPVPRQRPTVPMATRAGR